MTALLRLRRVAAFAAVSLMSAVGLPHAASAFDIQKVVSPMGITAWLVEDKTVPLVAMSFAFEGGAAQDPTDRPGVANMLTGLLDEGASDIDSEAFQARLEDLAIDLSFDAGRDAVFGSLRTLTENRAEAVRLLRLALTEPRFDAEPVDRIRAQLLAGIRRGERSPGDIASKLQMNANFPNHPYGRPVTGTADSVAAISVAEIKAFRAKNFARDNLRVAVVGSIDAATLGTMLDDVFGALPAKADLVNVADAVPAGAGRASATLATPQTTIRFTGQGLKRDDPDFMAASIATFILGGGGGSRLFNAVREQRGLTYSIGLSLDALDHAGLVAGSTSTRSDQAGTVIKVVEDEIARFAKDGPTEAELAKSKDYLMGSFPLRFVTSTRIARQLLSFQMDNLGIDYIQRRNQEVAAITIADVRKAAQRLFARGLMVVTVGKPVT
ncbi:pitrilysin family protein [soil metagenome]